MEDFARGVVAGFAVSAAVPAMYYFNKAALGTLFVVNREIGKALGRILLPSPPKNEFVPLKHVCEKGDDCTITSCFCSFYHYSCYECGGEKPKP